jgi:hypothetical protein
VAAAETADGDDARSTDGGSQKLQGTRTASLLAFMMIEFIRRDAAALNGAKFAEIGWILDDNGPMISIAEAIDAKICKTYRIYEKDLVPTAES